MNIKCVKSGRHILKCLVMEVRLFLEGSNSTVLPTERATLSFHCFDVSIPELNAEGAPAVK